MDKTQEDPYLIPAELEDAIRRRLSDLQVRSSQLQDLSNEYRSLLVMLGYSVRSPDQLLYVDNRGSSARVSAELLAPVLRARCDELRTAIDEELAR